MKPNELTASVKAKAGELGFSLVGMCSAVDATGVTRLDEWLARGYAGDMAYLAGRRAAYAHPRHVLEGCRSVVMLAAPYRTAEPANAAAGQGRVARYAWGATDYHDVIRERLHALADYLRELAPNAATRGVVDTAPFLEREFAQLAGLGWVGKNTLLLNRDAGSYFFLAALLTDVELAYDAPFAADYCGSCTACLDACPTQAFPQAYVLDASRCISYLTIEHRSAVPRELRAGIGDWLFGCDVCQEVCPWNGKAASASAGAALNARAEFAPVEKMNPVELAGLFALDEEAFRRRFRHTPLWRPHRRGLLRNAAIVLGNQRDASAAPALVRGLHDEEPLIRGACAWALGEIGGELAAQRLGERLGVEIEGQTASEIQAALARAVR